MPVVPSFMLTWFKDGFTQVVAPTLWGDGGELCLDDSIVFQIEVGLTNGVRQGEAAS
jgi:hypothetical protein